MAARAHRLRNRRTVLNRALAASFARVFPVQDLRPMLGQVGMDPGRCLWCRQPASSADHLFLLTQNGRWSEKPEVIVPACSSCNVMSAGRLDPTSWIATNPRIVNKAAAVRRLEKALGLVKPSRRLSASARKEMRNLYDQYERAWSELVAVDRRVDAWISKWAHPGGDRARATRKRARSRP